MKALRYETEPCRRCAGSGWFSYCQMWGHTCFECGVKPNEQGTGRRLTKAARLAMTQIQEFIEGQFSRRADQVEPGMLFKPYSYERPRVVLSVTPSGSGRLNPDGSIAYGVNVQVKGLTYVHQPDALLAVLPSAGEWDRVVLPFVRTLRGVSIDGETAIGVFRLVSRKGERRVECVERIGSVSTGLGLIAVSGPRVKRRMFIAPIEHDYGRIVRAA